MTRINCVPVTELSTKHLVAEYRELPRVYALSLAALQRGDDPADHPEQYALGTGHVKFFYSRIGYVRARHRMLIAEMRRRGYRVGFPNVPPAGQWPRRWHRGWEPPIDALQACRARLKARGG